MEKIILNEYTEIQNIYEKLNVFQKSVLSAISYYGGYDLYDNGGLLNDIMRNGKDMFDNVKDLFSALGFYDEYVENDKDNGFTNNDCIDIDCDYELANNYQKSVNECRDMLVKALTTGTDIDDLIEKDFQLKGDELTK